MAVAGNSLILAAIWRKTFQRTIFHILLSVLALTDLCTGLIAQPFTAAISLLFLVSDCNKPPIYKTIDANGDASATYFVASTAFITTLTRVERWFHMSRRSVVDSRRRCFILAVLPLIPTRFVVFRSLETIKGNPAFELNISIIAAALLCFLTTSVSYFHVLLSSVAINNKCKPMHHLGILVNQL